MPSLRPLVVPPLSLSVILVLAVGCGGQNKRYLAGAAPASPAYATHDTAMAAENPAPEMNTEAYDRIRDNRFVSTVDHPLSTFSIDVDTASYSNLRRFLRQSQLPPKDAVRIEELVNYFDYDYPQPAGDRPFSITTEVAPAPWAPDHRLVHIGLQGRTIAPEALPPRNLVFLLDVSGSMEAPGKLPLLRSAFSLLVRQLGPRDHVAIVVYAGASGVVLAPTPGDQQEQILDAINRLQAGGSTNGAGGIQMAYQLAEQNFAADAINRVILATDGDFNVGTTDRGALVRLIEAKRESGVFLTVLGFGMGNLKDATMEELADHGNGNYAYIDSIAEARKVLVTEAGSTLVTIAKDVKIQVEFNPARVASYRLIGYENRLLRDEEFNDDSKDAGDIGAGHTVTALYEIVAGPADPADAAIDPLRYQGARADAPSSTELMNVKLRYKAPDGDISQRIEVAVADRSEELEATSDNFRFSAAVAGFGMLLRDSPDRGAITFAQVAALADRARGADRHGYRSEFLELVAIAARSSGAPTRAIATP